MASNLRVADLYLGGSPAQALPVDYKRTAKPQTHGGVGASFIDTRPRGGRAILTPAVGKQHVDPSRSLYKGGVVTSLPIGGPKFIGRGS
jgi:hypothetical protein